MILRVVTIATLLALISTGKVVGKETQESRKALADSNLVAIENFRLGMHDFICKVTYSVDSEDIANYEMIIYKESNNTLVEAFKYETVDAFLAFSNVDGRLLVIWEGGSAFHFKVYDVVDQEVRLVFDGGSHNLPEIADLDNNGTMEILISEGRMLESKGKTFQYPEKTIIYKWSGNDYKALKEVEWKNRFCK